MTVNRDSDSLQEGDEGQAQAIKGAPDSATLQLAAEELSVSKETVETGRVRVTTRTREREALIDEELAVALRVLDPRGHGGHELRDAFADMDAVDRGT